jgi:uncharacterized protein (TIGR02145 family)
MGKGFLFTLRRKACSLSSPLLTLKGSQNVAGAAGDRLREGKGLSTPEGVARNDRPGSVHVDPDVLHLISYSIIMKPIHLFFASICLCVSLSGCKKEINEPDPIVPPTTGGGSTYFGSSIQLNVAGQVFNESGQPLEGVAIAAGFGNQTTITDANGAFILQGITGYDRLGYVRATKPGYFTGSRSFVPVDGTNTVRITLLAKNIAGTVQGNAGGIVEAEGVQITFSPNSFIRNGTQYTGPVNVALNHIDPSSEELFQQMPGALIGTMDNSAQMLRSFGMVGVELTDGAGTEVEIASGSTAEVRFPVPSSMMSEAPSTIDLWSFNEDPGHWVHEGTAELMGSEYVANVGHFSWWNVDVPASFVQMTGKLVHQTTGLPIAGAQVIVQTQSMGAGITSTSTEGFFSGPVPIESLNIEIRINCSQEWETIYTSTVGPYSNTFDLQVEVLPIQLTTLQGSVTDCEGAPITTGYVIIDQVVHWLNSGAYGVITCNANSTIQAVDQNTSEISDPIAVQLSGGTFTIDLQACGELVSSGSVTDIDGNVYPTVVIGSQEWMASNLRTTRFSNSEPISQLTDQNAWYYTTQPAWCAYENDVANIAIYGRLYNGFVVLDSRNVCPEGWHVPTDSDWIIMESFLGLAPGDTMFGWIGGSGNVGSKLKSVEMWQSPHPNDNNSSGFTAMPSGARVGYIPDEEYFTGSGLEGYFWTQTATVDGGHVIVHHLEHDRNDIHHGVGDERNGYSIRCIRD